MHVNGLALIVGVLLFAGAPFGVTPQVRAETPDTLKVVVTIPVLKDWAYRVGGSHVQVVSLISGLESEHTYSPKPSDLVAVRKARVLLEVGLGLEVWVSSLIKSAGNHDLLVVTTSSGIALMRGSGNHPTTEGARGGGRHRGNPHVWLDPENAKTMIRHITEAFIKVDSEHAADYRKNQAEYLRELDNLQDELVGRLREVPDRRIVVHHPAWPYFARRFGLKIEGQIVSQAGAEPSAHHLQALIQQIRKHRIRVIVSEPQLNQKIPRVLAHDTNARVVVLTPLPGGLPGTDTYLDMLRYDVWQLAEALEESKSMEG
ncbi:MAG: metal ABC transporter substrate-binding protein [Nitrospiraceae bacterium]